MENGFLGISKPSNSSNAFAFLFNSNSTENPGRGHFSFDIPIVAAAGLLRVSVVDCNNANANNFISDLTGKTLNILSAVDTSYVTITVGAVNNITATYQEYNIVVTLVNGNLSHNKLYYFLIGSSAGGSSGFSGYSGSNGSTGSSGFSGYSGSNGSTGSSGFSGYSGSNGSAGTSGFSGYSGRSGYSGISGYSGVGTSGFSGYSGKSGYSGISGYSGVGTSGYSGYSGVDSSTRPLKFNSSTSAGNPGSTFFTFNTSDLTTASLVSVSSVDNSGGNIYNWLALFNYSDATFKGTICFQTQSGFGIFGVMSVTIQSGSPTYFDLAISPISSNGVTIFTNNEVVKVSITVNGSNGASGTSGFSGLYGGISATYFYDSSQSAPSNPGANKFWFDDIGFDTNTVLSISKIDWNSIDYENFILSATNSIVKLTSMSDPNTYVIYHVTAITDNISYVDWSLSYIGASAHAGDFTNNEPIIISIGGGISGYSGKEGPSGFSGYSGYSGSGVSGYSGYSGYSGSGVSGYSGYSGIAGESGYSGYSGPTGTSGFSGYSGKSGYSGISGYSGTTTTPQLQLYSALGGAVKAEPVFGSAATILSTITPSNQQIFGIAVYLPTAVTLTGVKWYQSTIGNYTANNYNGVGLYTYSGGTLTNVASSTNDGNIWQTAASSSFGSKAFSSTYNASPGIYFILGLYCRSAVTTSPVLGATTAVGNNVIPAYDFTNSARWNPFFSTQTTMPGSIAMSSAAASSVQVYLALY